MNKPLKTAIICGVIIVILNFIMHGFFLMAIERPIFYYEYLALPLVFTFSSNHKIRWVILCLIIVGDAIVSLARFYFFDSFNYLTKIPSIFLSDFSISFWLIVLFGLAFFVFFVYIMIQILSFIPSDKNARKRYGKLLILFFIVVYSIDIKTGNSFFYFKTLGNNQTNFSQSLIAQYYNDAKIFFKRYSPVNEMKNYHNESITYKYFLKDNSNKQVLIILESWGYILDSTIRMNQVADLLSLRKMGYKVETDSSTFQGGTSQAEARELLNKTGEAYYSIIQNLPTNLNSIIKYKNEMGYTSIALQGFSGFHSSGYLFRKSLGFVAIKELKFFKDSLLYTMNYNNHYEAVNDEEVIDYGIQQSFRNPKSFTYILTINTHLPFKGSMNNQTVNQQELRALPSQEAMDQYTKFKEQFKVIKLLLEKYPIDKLVIVGDHPAPFINNKERDFYSKKRVPAIIITKTK